MLKFNQHQKSDRAPFIIYADLECFIEKIDGSKNNPENLFTAKVVERISPAFSIATMPSFKSTENKDCEKIFC